MTNAQVVQRALDVGNDPNLDAPEELFEELFAPDVVFDMSQRIFNPNVYRGYEGLRQYRADVRETWTELSFEPQELIEEGDHVLAITRMRGVGRLSGVPIDAEGPSIWTVVDGRITGFRFLGEISREEALAALREAAAGSRTGGCG